MNKLMKLISLAGTLVAFMAFYGPRIVITMAHAEEIAAQTKVIPGGQSAVQTALQA
jgi:hypothetical protein